MTKTSALLLLLLLLASAVRADVLVDGHTSIRHEVVFTGLAERTELRFFVHWLHDDFARPAADGQPIAGYAPMGVRLVALTAAEAAVEHPSAFWKAPERVASGTIHVRRSVPEGEDARDLRTTCRVAAVEGGKLLLERRDERLGADGHAAGPDRPGSGCGLGTTGTPVAALGLSLVALGGLLARARR